MKKSDKSVKIGVSIKTDQFGGSDIVRVPVVFFSGPFAVHPRVCSDNSLCPDSYTVTHVPTGHCLLFYLKWKTKAVELAKLLNSLVSAGIISNRITSSREDEARAAFSKNAYKFLVLVERNCRTADRVRELKFQELFDSLFLEELNSKPNLEQQSLFGEACNEN